MPALVTTPVVAEFTRPLRTVSGAEPGYCCRYRAAAPTTCGVAIDVPLIVFVAVSLVCQVDMIEDPGAKMSRHDP